MLNAICGRLKPALCTKDTFLCKGDLVNEILFVILGYLDSYTANRDQTRLFNSCHIGPVKVAGVQSRLLEISLLVGTISKSLMKLQLDGMTRVEHRKSEAWLVLDANQDVGGNQGNDESQISNWNSGLRNDSIGKKSENDSSIWWDESGIKIN
ncbi:putative cyclic nucleotide-gated ion channel 15, partial [Mucuna pruriens]